MSTIWIQEPPFPESELGPGTTRYKLGDYWIDWNEPGVPTEADIAVSQNDIICCSVREERDVRLNIAGERIVRYWSQVQGGITPTESAAVYASLLAYAQDLRDVPQQVGFPNTINWPVVP